MRLVPPTGEPRPGLYPLVGPPGGPRLRVQGQKEQGCASPVEEGPVPQPVFELQHQPFDNVRQPPQLQVERDGRHEAPDGDHHVAAVACRPRHARLREDCLPQQPQVADLIGPQDALAVRPARPQVAAGVRSLAAGAENHAAVREGGGLLQKFGHLVAGEGGEAAQTAVDVHDDEGPIVGELRLEVPQDRVRDKLPQLPPAARVGGHDPLVARRGGVPLKGRQDDALRHLDVGAVHLPDLRVPVQPNLPARLQAELEHQAFDRGSVERVIHERRHVENVLALPVPDLVPVRTELPDAVDGRDVDVPPVV
mmetsp:Transcript_105524/g.308575  ORF Transcript_105524/g.308575 Transcript_105524/m.308575 type:complete len:309 (-) Transcript_105524:263-1189(-)